MSNLLPLYFDFNPKSWRLHRLRSTDESFIRFRDVILKRDDHSCRYCGFQANDYMDVINIDYDYSNNKMANMATVCPLCRQSVFLHMVGKLEFGGGVIIYAPHISQAELNGLSHVIFCAMNNNTDYQVTAEEIYKNFKLMSQPIETLWGKGLSSPSMLSQMIIDTPLKNRDSVADKILQDCRLLPSRTGFSDQLAKWSTKALEAGLTDPA